MSKTELSDAQEQHMGEILYFFAHKYQDKYTKGALEHQSQLWDFSDDELLEFALEEVLDLVSYLTTIIQNRKKRRGKKQH